MSPQSKSFLGLMLLSSTLLFGQQRFELEVFATPFIKQFQNVESQSIYIAHPAIIMNYYKNPAQEYGLQFNFNPEWRIGFFTGVSWYQEKVGMDFHIIETTSNSPNEITFFHYGKNIDFQRLGVKLGITYHINDRWQLDGLLNTYLRLETKIDNEGSIEFYQYNYPPHESNFHVKVRDYTAYAQTRFVPELRLSAEVWKGFRLYIGTRLKFFGNSYVKTSVQGSTTEIAYSDEVLHQSYLKGNDFSCFIGVSYRFGVKQSDEK